MTPSRVSLSVGVLAALALLLGPGGAVAQDNKKCTGKEPGGGRWATSAELYLQKARENPDPETKRERYRQALEQSLEGTVEQPDNPRNYKMAGEAYVGLNDYVAADSMWNAAVQMWSCYGAQIDTLRYRAWVGSFNSGVRYSQSGDLEKAQQSYQQAWTIFKKLPQPQLQLGGIYAQEALSADTEEKRQEYQQKAIDAYQAAVDAMGRASDRLNQEQLHTYRRAASFNLAQLLAFEERYEESAEAYQEFLAQEPGNIDALENAAVVLTRAAQKAASEAAELEDGPDKQALLEKADAFQAEAQAYYDQLLAREDLEAEDYHNVGLGLMQTGRQEQAIQAFEMALDLQPYRHNSLEQLAMAYFQSQKYDALKGAAEKLVQRYPLSLNNLALLANAYREAEDADNALATLERREELPIEVTDLQLNSEEGVYTINGYVQNIKGEAGTPLELRFDFYNDAGQVVATETVTVTLPEQGVQTGFDVATESAALISGFTYQRAGEGQQAETG